MRRAVRWGVLIGGALGLLTVVLVSWGVTQMAHWAIHKKEARQALKAGDYDAAAKHLADWYKSAPHAATKDRDYGAIAHGIATAKSNDELRLQAGDLMEAAILK